MSATIKFIEDDLGKYLEQQKQQQAWPASSSRRTSTALVTTSSSSQQLTVKAPQTALQTFNDPRLRKRKSTKNVLSEDEYVATLGKIIERDYFPDSYELKQQLQRLEELENRENRFKKIGLASRDEPAVSSSSTSHEDSTKIDIDNLTVETFFHNFTSEDNESFEELHEKDKEEHRRLYHWMYESAIPTLCLENSNSSSNSSNVKDQQKAGMLMLYYLGGKVLTASERKKMDRLLNSNARNSKFGDDVEDPNTDTRVNIGSVASHASAFWKFQVQNQLLFPPSLDGSRFTSGLPELQGDDPKDDEARYYPRIGDKEEKQHQQLLLKDAQEKEREKENVKEDEGVKLLMDGNSRNSNSSAQEAQASQAQAQLMLPPTSRRLSASSSSSSSSSSSLESRQKHIQRHNTSFRSMMIHQQQQQLHLNQQQQQENFYREAPHTPSTTLSDDDDDDSDWEDSTLESSTPRGGEEGEESSSGFITYTVDNGVPGPNSSDKTKKITVTRFQRAHKRKRKSHDSQTSAKEYDYVPMSPMIHPNTMQSDLEMSPLMTYGALMATPLPLSSPSSSIPPSSSLSTNEKKLKALLYADGNGGNEEDWDTTKGRAPRFEMAGISSREKLARDLEAKYSTTNNNNNRSTGTEAGIDSDALRKRLRAANNKDDIFSSTPLRRGASGSSSSSGSGSRSSSSSFVGGNSGGNSSGGARGRGGVVAVSPAAIALADRLKPQRTPSVW